MFETVKSNRKTLVIFFILNFMPWVWGLSFGTYDALAKDAGRTRPIEDIDSAPLERISPLLLAYHRLKAVLKTHGNPENIPFKLPTVTKLFEDPMGFPSAVVRLTDEPERFMAYDCPGRPIPGADRLIQAFSENAARVLLGDPAFKDGEPDPLVENNEIVPLKTLMNRIITRTALADILVKSAFSDISDQETTRLLKRFPKSVDEFFNTGNLSDQDAFWIIDAAKKIRLADLFYALRTLSTVFSDEVLEKIQRTAATEDHIFPDASKYPGLKGEFLMIRETPMGLVLVGGPGPNVYGMNASIIIDLGGDDVYLNNAATPVHGIQDGRVISVQHAVGVLIDFDGNDRYITPGFASVGSGFFGLGVLLDKAGNDFYSGGQLSVGAACFGVGVLMDMAGNDTYVSTEGGQGAALFGAALLFDGTGNDLFQGAKYVQGFGGPMGYGKLRDLRGNDHYRAGWKQGSSYGTKGIYEGRSQGVGWGLRMNAAGGIGLLHDGFGDDVYEAGNFSQGTGYYLSLGVLRDDQGNDDYRGSRYCQGSAAHRAIGALLDFEGNDCYLGKIAANQGAAWDLSMACLMDYQGNDRYGSGDLSLGAAAQNGMGMFFDGAGSDRYDSPERALGFSGDLSYGGGRNAGNMAIFLDAGGQRDFFTLKNRTNHMFTVLGNFGIFLDE